MTAASIVIRAEAPGDEPAIRQITIDAFAASVHGYHGEAELVDRLRASCTDRLSLVAEASGRIAGHILFTPVLIQDGMTSRAGMGLAPLSVAPAVQRHGVGSQLVRTGVEHLRAGGCPFVVVLGDPVYYGRFGFLPASQFGVTSDFTDAPADAFQILPLKPFEPTAREGLARFRPEFYEAP